MGLRGLVIRRVAPIDIVDMRQEALRLREPLPLDVITGEFEMASALKSGIAWGLAASFPHS